MVGMETGINYLNIQYIIYRAYEGLRSVVIAPGDVPRAVSIFVQDITIIGLTLALILLALIVYVRIRLLQVEHAGFHHKEEEDRRRFTQEVKVGTNSRWDMVVALASSSDESDWRRAILEADVLLANALSDRGIPGETMAEQFNNVNPLTFTTLDLAQEAHGMRNTLAHLGEAFPLSQRDMQSTIDLYRQVFEELGII